MEISPAPVQTPSTHARRSALSDARMLDASVRLIVKRGPDKTTLKEVGERAGYSRGLAGYRFGSKAGLFGFVVKSIGEEWLRELTRVTRNKIGLDALSAAADAHYRFCVEAPDHLRAFYLLWFESIGPGSEYRNVIAGIHRRRQRDVTTWIEAGINEGTLRTDTDAGAAAAQYCTSIIGIVYQWLMDPEDLGQIEQLYAGLKCSMALLLARPEATA